MNNQRRSGRIKPSVLLYACTIVLINSIASVSAHETEIMTEESVHDDQAPTIAEEAQILLRAESEKIGYNPETTGLRRVAKARIDAANSVGKWGAVQNWPVIPVFVSLLHDGRVLAFDSVGDRPTESYQNHTYTRATIWNPSTNQFSDAQVDTGYNIFCSGFSSLPDGDLFIAGGNADARLNGLRKTHLFSPSLNSWELELDMQASRWYPAVTPLANGEMLITGGGPAISEVRENDGQLRQLTGAAKSYWANRDYPWLQTAPDGRVAFFGPHNQLGYVTTSGVGSWQNMGQRDNTRRSYGSYAMYDIGKVLVAGGGYQNSGFDQRSSVSINLNNNTVSSTSSMAHRRRQHNLTVLADGSVLATGGFSSNAGLVDLNNAVFAAEVWSPSSGKWKTLASEARARQYHSTALLLPDGRVLSAGGGICGACQQAGYIQKNAQIFSPPYLFKADGSGNLATRPIIENAPAEIGYSQTAMLETSQANDIRKVGLIRTGSVTHSQNMEQRYIPLSFTAQNGMLDITTPSNANIAPPGHYMLFIINSSGVPSVASIVKVSDIIVEPPVPSDPAYCDIGSDPSTTTLGKGAALWWWIEGATSGTITDNVGGAPHHINSSSIPSDYIWFYPEKTATYTLKVNGNNNQSATCKVDITVLQQRMPYCEMGADPEVINKGEGAALWWWIEDAKSASITSEDNLFRLNITSNSIPSDYTWFYPQATTVYNMTAVNEDGSIFKCKSKITVR